MNNATTTEAANPSDLSARAFDVAAEMVMDLNPVLASIESAKLPVGLVPANIRSLGQKERTAAIRSLLKASGVKMGARGNGVSVKSATGSMCYWTTVRYESIDHAPGVEMHSRFYCPTCKANAAASEKLHTLILAAFPDLGDRSDIQVDHFDFVYTVNGG